ncbi:MAG: hypothetical protein H2212_03415 [Ruminococcus sp.]|nr:hypothetical protein [Ruminococcus sp.]
MEKPDVIWGQIEAIKENNVYRDFLEGTIIPTINNRSTDEIVLYLSNAEINLAPSVLYIVNLEFLKVNNLYFQDIPYEDDEWSSKVLTYVNKVYIYCKRFYRYRLREGSLSSCKNFEMYWSYAKIVQDLYSLSISISSPPRIEFLHNRCRYLLYRIRNEMHSLEIMENEKLFKQLYSFNQNN